MANQKSNDPTKHEINLPKNLQHMLSLKKQLTKTSGPNEKEELMKEIGVFETELRAECRIVPGIKSLAFISDSEFEGALWIYDKYLHLKGRLSDLDAKRFLSEINESESWLEVIIYSALIYRLAPARLIKHCDSWYFLSKAMAERAEFLYDYMLEPWKEPLGLAGVLADNGNPVPNGEYHLKLDLGLEVVPDKYKGGDSQLVVSWLCGNIIESDLLQEIYLSPEFKNLGLSALPKLEDALWNKGLRDQQEWWINFAKSLTAAKNQATHSSDFSSVNWQGQRYYFSKGQQAAVVRILWEEWKKGGHAISQETIQQKLEEKGVKAPRSQFRLDHLFRNRGDKGYHPAWGTMIIQVKKGIYGLSAPKNTE